MVKGSSMSRRLQQNTKTKLAFKTSVRKTLLSENSSSPTWAFLDVSQNTHKICTPFLQRSKPETMRIFFFFLQVFTAFIQILLGFCEIIFYESLICAHTKWIKREYEGLHSTKSELHCMQISSTCQKKWNQQIKCEHVLVWTRVNIFIGHLTDLRVNIQRRMVLAGVNGFSKNLFVRSHRSSW